jgi:hypothetical protein
VAKIGLPAIAVVLVLGAADAGLAQQSIMISPQVTQLEAAPGSAVGFEIIVGNASEKSPITIEIGSSPVAQNERGDYAVSTKPNEWSCATWIEISEKRVTLGPGESSIIKCILKVPHTASGGRYAAVTVSFSEGYNPTAGISTRLQYALASYVELVIARTRVVRSAEISNLEIKPIIGNAILEGQYGRDAFLITADVHNKGNIAITGNARLRIREQKGLHVREVPLGGGRGVVLPGATVKYRSLFPKRPPPGIYSAEASLDYEGMRPSLAKCQFTVTQDGSILPGRVETVQTIGLAVTPRVLSVTAAPGARRTLGIALENVEEESLKISTNLSPISQMEDGRFVASGKPGDLAVADWINIEPASFEMPPKSRKRIKISLNVPRDIDQSQYFRIAFTPDASGLSADIIEDSYSTDILLGVPRGVPDSLALTSCRATSEGRYMPFALTFTLENLGGIHVTIDATIAIRDSRGKPIRDLRLLEKNRVILPQTKRTFTMSDAQGMESGDYEAELSVKIGNKMAAYSLFPFKIPK